MHPISKEVAPDLNRRQRSHLAKIAGHFDFKKRLLEQMSEQFPSLTINELQWRIDDLYGSSYLEEQFAIALLENGKEKWPNLTIDEILFLIEDGSLQSSPMDFLNTFYNDLPETQQDSTSNRFNFEKSQKIAENILMAAKDIDDHFFQGSTQKALFSFLMKNL